MFLQKKINTMSFSVFINAILASLTLMKLVGNF